MADGHWPLATGHWPLEGRVLLEGRLVTSWFRVVAPPPQHLEFEGLRPRFFLFSNLVKTRPACFSNLQRNARHAKSRCCAVFRFSSAPDALAFCISLAPYPERMSWLNFVAHVLAPVTHLYYICGRYVSHCLHIAPDLGHIVGTLPADSVTSLAHLWHISDTSLAHLWGECTPLSPQRLSRLRACRALGPVPQIDILTFEGY